MKIKLLKVSYFFLIVFFFSNMGTSMADTIVLKNGSKIEVDKAWDEGGFIKGSSGKGTIGFPKDSVGTVIYKKENQHDSFEFDLWKAGITIENAFKIAESNEIPLVRVGNVSMGDVFNNNVYKYINDSDIFHYKSILMGKHSDISLCFTPLSRILYKVEIKFSGFGANSKEFKDEILSMLINKYGDRNRFGFQLLGNTRTWSMKKKYIIKMIDQMSFITIEYSDTALDNQNKAEIKKIKDMKKKENAKKDSSKF